MITNKLSNPDYTYRLATWWDAGGVADRTQENINILRNKLGNGSLNPKGFAQIVKSLRELRVARDEVSAIQNKIETSL